jgi:tetratricopeptide (TPR) repeat protein
MKTKLLTFTLAAILGAGLFALPLTVLVMKESEKIADTIRAFNKECAGVNDTALEQQAKDCYEKHGAIAQALAKFVILANQELDFLPENPHSADSEPKKNPSFDAWKKLHPDYNPGNEDKRTLARRKDMQLQIRWAQYWINCLGREGASECKQERTALDKETYPFGRVGLMSNKPTHVGEEEAKHWHPMEIDVGNGSVAAEQRDAVPPSGGATRSQAHYAQNSNLPPDCIELSPEEKPRDGDYYQTPPEHKPGNVPDSYVLTKVYQHGVFLGWCYMDKSAVERLHMAKRKAAELYQKAADQGDPNAETNLGWLYHEGKGVPQDYHKAVELFQKAADQGYAVGQAYLASAYADGKGVPRDYSKAVDLFHKALDQGPSANVFNDVAWFLATCPDAA